MTTYDVINPCKCALCSADSRQIVITSTNRFGLPDLDTRPPEMMRSTMPHWIQKCPHCGYVSSSISKPAAISLNDLKSNSYTECDNIPFKSQLAADFYRRHLICLLENNQKGAMWALIHAAWASDDKRDDDSAIICRKKALEQLEELKDINNQIEYILIKADLLRRSEQFGRLLDEYRDFHSSDKAAETIIQFQIKKSKMHDACSYTVSEAKNNFSDQTDPDQADNNRKIKRLFW